MKSTSKVAIAFALAALLLASGLNPPATVRAQAPSQPSSDSGFITFRVQMTNVSFYDTVPSDLMNTVKSLAPTPDSERNYIIDGDLVADGNASADCHAQGRAPQSRFFTPRFIDFTLHVINGNQGTQASECANANYTLSLIPYEHDTDDPVDLNGTAWTSPSDLCPKVVIPNNRLTVNLVHGCVGTIHLGWPTSPPATRPAAGSTARRTTRCGLIRARIPRTT